jgi:hypothetical protein
VAALDIPDCWIGAGLIRNAVWDHLHGVEPEAIAGSDVDVVYCDPGRTNINHDLGIEARLIAANPAVAWSVHNQARMHERNGDEPYRNAEDAISRWPETATAIAARLLGDRMDVIAPHGVDDLLGLIVRPTPAFRHRLEQFRSRIAAKDWARRWPLLKFQEV